MEESLLHADQIRINPQDLTMAGIQWTDESSFKRGETSFKKFAEHGWELVKTVNAIGAYKKFVFMGISGNNTGHQVAVFQKFQGSRIGIRTK